MAELPLSGLGSAGNVQVVVHHHVSNVAQLTEWRTQSDQVTFTLFGDGTQQQRQNFSLHMRADIRQWRKVIHEPPSEPQGYIFSAEDSSATLSSSGSATGPGLKPLTLKWTGTDTLVNGYGSPTVSDNVVYLDGGFTDSKHLIFSLGDYATHGGSCITLPCSGGSCTTPLTSWGPAIWFAIWTGNPNSEINTEFEASGNSVSIKGGSQSGEGLGPDCTFSNNGRGQLTWASIPSVPDTGPDPDSAR